MTRVHVLGIDPSGAFYEGKGTTGLSVVSKGKHSYRIDVVDELSAKNFMTAEAYWEAHLKKIAYYKKRYLDLIVSMEDYVLYESKAISQINSHFETSQLIGCIRLYCWQNNIELHVRPAVAVKLRWTDDILVRKGLLTCTGKQYYCNTRESALSGHIRDSIRHGIHCIAFELKGGN